MDKIDLVIKIIEDRMAAFKIARSIVRYDSAEKAIIDVRMEDMQYLLARLIDLKKGTDEISGESVRKSE